MTLTAKKGSDYFKCVICSWVFFFLSQVFLHATDGAALFYMNMKDDKNLQVLHKYLLHRSYSMPFKESAWVIDKDAIFMYVRIMRIIQ